MTQPVTSWLDLFIASRYGLEHSLNKYEGTLFSSKWQNGSRNLMGPFLCPGDQILGCPVRWTVPWTDIFPLNHSRWGSLPHSPTVGSQSWFQEGQNGMAELPVDRRAEGNLAASQPISTSPEKSSSDQCCYSCSQGGMPLPLTWPAMEGGSQRSSPAALESSVPQS